MVRSARLALTLGVLTLCLATASQARKKRPKAPDDGLPSVEDTMTKAREVYTDLKGNSNPVVRRVVFAGLLELDKDDQKAALEMGLKESDWDIKARAIGLALEGKDRAAQKRVEGIVQKLLESGEEAERARGYALVKAHYGPKPTLQAAERAAKDGTPEARTAARARLLAYGGKVAWKVIEAGLKEGDGTPERAQALEALKTFADPLGVKWALATIHDPTLGELARDYLVRVKDVRAGKGIDKTLRSAYDKSADFETRLRIASILAGRGQTELVSKTLHAGLRFNQPSARLIAWKGLAGARDLVLFGKLREKIMTNEKEAEADLAFAWMAAWAKDNAEPQVIELLQTVGRSDRRDLRLKALAILTDIKHRPSKPLFEEALAEGQPEMRLAGARGLAAVAKVGDEKFIADRLRREPDAEVKALLVNAMAVIGTPDIIDSLQFVITSPQKEIKLAAARAVAKTGDPKAATLMGLLKRDPDLDIRFVAWESLLVLKPESFAEFKAGALSWLTAEQVEALGKNPRISLDVFEFIASAGSDEQRLYAVGALEARGADAATRLLSLVQREQHPDTAASALQALATQRKVESLGTYRKAVKSTHGEVRAVAFNALGRFGERRLLETVLGGMADKDPYARAEAARAAVQLADRVTDAK